MVYWAPHASVHNVIVFTFLELERLEAAEPFGRLSGLSFQNNASRFAQRLFPCPRHVFEVLTICVTTIRPHPGSRACCSLLHRQSHRMASIAPSLSTSGSVKLRESSSRAGGFIWSLNFQR